MNIAGLATLLKLTPELLRHHALVLGQSAEEIGTVYAMPRRDVLHLARKHNIRVGDPAHNAFREKRKALLPVHVLSESKPRQFGVAFLDATSQHCRWPLGEPADFDNFRFCGAQVIEGHSYCRHHYNISVDRTVWAQKFDYRARKIPVTR